MQIARTLTIREQKTFSISTFMNKPLWNMKMLGSVSDRFGSGKMLVRSLSICFCRWCIAKIWILDKADMATDGERSRKICFAIKSEKRLTKNPMIMQWIWSFLLINILCFAFYRTLQSHWDPQGDWVSNPSINWYSNIVWIFSLSNPFFNVPTILKYFEWIVKLTEER